jgi:tRNA A-37 threonylcarbamoyl transferase component Bud32
MALRRLLRGTASETELEAVGREAADRQDTTFESVRPLEADNWLSTPAVLNESLFLKLISTQNTVVHGLLTTGRNLGAFSSGNEAFFKRFSTPLEMAVHELEATRAMRSLGVNAPEPLEAFEHDGYGVLVLEFLPAFETLDDLGRGTAERVAPTLFDALARLHRAGLAHGDLRSENVLVTDDDLYFVDATKVSEAAVEDARAYDVACALAALEPLVGATAAVAAASDVYPDTVLRDAVEYMGFVNLRPDHTFGALTLRGEIEKTAAADTDT